MRTRSTPVLLGIALSLFAAPLLGQSAQPPVGEETGRPRSSRAVTTLSVEQREALRLQLERFLSRDATGLVARLRSDGATVIDLDRGYQHAVLVRPEEDGGRAFGCFADADAAVAFLARSDESARSAAPEVRRTEAER